MSDTISCATCQAAIPSSASYCPNCGAKIDAVGPVAPIVDEAHAVSAAAPPPDPSGPLGTDDVTRVIPLPDDATQVEPVGLHDATRVYPVVPPMAAPAGDPAPTFAQPGPGWSPPPPQPAAPAPGWGPPPPAWGQPAAEPAAWGKTTAAPQQWAAPSGPTPWAVAPTATRSAGVAAVAASLAFVGAILLIAGVFAPWIESTGNVRAISGWDFVSKSTAELQSFKRSPDPAILLGIGAVVILVGGLLLAGVARTLARLALAAAGIGAGAILVIDYLAIRQAVKDNFGTDVRVTYQYGFWLCVAGAVLCLVASAIPAKRR